jgi:HJR/Mrr/RecB family endonuclease
MRSAALRGVVRSRVAGLHPSSFSGSPEAGRFGVVSKIDDLADRAVTALVTSISGWMTASLAIFLYAGIGLALPIALHCSVRGFVELNALGTSFAGLVIIAWIAVQAQAANRRHLLDWTTELRHLNSEEFEWLVGEMFRREGWDVRETGRQDGPDGNIDLELSMDGRRHVVQCKRWTSWTVGVDQIRQFLGTLLREDLDGRAGIFVTLSDYTPQARSEAKQAGLVLVDGRELFARVEKVRGSELCPECHMPMRLNRSEHGWWFRCTSEGCRGKRHLGKDAGRAVELLMQASLTSRRSAAVVLGPARDAADVLGLAEQ